MHRFLSTAAMRLTDAQRPVRIRRSCQLPQLGALAACYVLLEADAATQRFIEEGFERHWLHDLAAELAAALLQLCLTAADANLACNLWQMWVLSTSQARALFEASGGWTRGRCL